MSDLTDELSASCMCLEDSSVAGTLIRCSYCKALARIEALEALFVDEEELRSRIRALEVEVTEWRQSALYDPMTHGPRFKGWDRSQMDRCRKRFIEREKGGGDA